VYFIKSIIETFERKGDKMKQPTISEFKDNLLALLDIINNQ